MALTLIDEVLEQLRSDPEAGWALFLRDYAGLIFQVVRHFQSDPDDAADCFQSVCEHLCADGFRRLRKFRSDGTASFTTWLRAVVRNLCFDWHRKRFGRRRVFRSIARLSQLDREIYQSIYERRANEIETLQDLSSRFPNLTPEVIAESVARINNALTTTQRWSLKARSVSDTEHQPTNFDVGNLAADAADPRPDPETQAIFAESRSNVRSALRRLPPDDRLLLRLRFEEELTLEQIAKLMGLGNAQRADRQIKNILTRLRNELPAEIANAAGKTAPASVKTLRKNSV